MTKKQRPYAQPTTRATAARAIFDEANDLPRVELTFTLTNGEQCAFDMNVHELGKLIEMSMNVYNTILPPLKTSRGGFGL